MPIIDGLSANPSFFLFAVFILGLSVGSFLNVVIYRLPVMIKRDYKCDCLDFLHDENETNSEPLTIPVCTDKEQSFNLSLPRSHCPSCDHKIRAIENIPLLSWLVLKGKCSQCKNPISIRYPLVELATGLLSLLLAYSFGVQWFTLAALFLCWALIALTMIDFDTHLLPDDITLPFLWLGIISALLHLSDVSLADSIIGAISGYLSLWSIYQLFKLVTKKEGMGYGDFKLFALLGAWLGWQALPLILLLSAVVGSIVGISLILFLGRDRQIPIPFGPYLCAAGFISLLWGEPIQRFYFNLSGL